MYKGSLRLLLKTFFRKCDNSIAKTPQITNQVICGVCISDIT